CNRWRQLRASKPKSKLSASNILHYQIDERVLLILWARREYSAGIAWRVASTTIRQQTARARKVRKQGHGRKAVMNCEFRERLRVRSDQGRLQHENRSCGSLCRRHKSLFEIRPGAHLDNVQLDGQRTGRLLYCIAWSSRGGRVPQNGDPGELGNGLP